MKTMTIVVVVVVCLFVCFYKKNDRLVIYLVTWWQLHLGFFNFELIDNGEEKIFDMAYIDADKWNYHVYYDKCIQLVRKGGVILMDDVRITQ